MVLPVLRPFFYARPIRLSPLDDGLWILFTGLAFGLLTAPAHPMKNVPDTGRIISNPEVFFNYLGDPLKRPQLGPIAVLAGAFQKQRFQPAHLFFRQPALASRRTVGFKKRLAKLLIGLFPIADGAWTGTDKPGNLLVPVALFQQSNGFTPSLLQLLRGS